MFSGIIFHQGMIASVTTDALGGMRLRVDAPTLVAQLRPSSSVSVNGVCLTVIEVDEQGFLTDVMPQTLSLTTAATWKQGDKVNLESSLRIGDELGGHFVYGHVDGLAEVVAIENAGNAVVVTLRPPESLMKYIAPQGSVTLDGVSLTVADLQSETFTVSLIPETVRLTTWKQVKIGGKVNLEVDMMIKYLDHLHAVCALNK